ncbi:MAG: M1 family metallopeptidase [Sphingobacteriales bacterium]|nr:M1 family metallopeptidase [Sphingobacteriales bacterium]
MHLLYSFRKVYVLILTLFVYSSLSAQIPEQKAEDTSWKKIYRATPTKDFDLINTKLDVRFDYDKAYMYGKAQITLKPHFYPQKQLRLDAKGMELHEVSLLKRTQKVKLSYDYSDENNLYITLDKEYKGGENLTIYIDYTAKPNEYAAKGSEAIKDAKGLYFINPKGEDKEKPIQIWTQGETESNSVWCPTIDKPNQRQTDEISMTVPDKYVTLSNGLLVTQKKNADGTRTDTWKMDLPHAPYLMMMGVGDFKIYKDKWRNKEVNYYLEPAYAPYAKQIFGNTPELMEFYSKILGVDFPWQKYSQIVVRDFVSGAEENTTATVHNETVQRTPRELLDGNQEDYLAHELFHQWFGDLVTTESWSNITVNESMANYSEVLWFGYKYGKDAGDAKFLEDMTYYLSDPRKEKLNLVRFNYADKEDVFDLVSYQKGGCILHMLRNYVGDSAFFKALNLYLTTNKFKSTEATNLRMAFEEVTGEDLNWFWNQWYYRSGHPNLKIDYVYTGDKVKVIIQQQTEKIFRLPIAIDIYNGDKKERHKVWIEKQSEVFDFPYKTKPDLVNVDGDKILLCVKEDNKTMENFVHQFKYAGNFMDRHEELEYFYSKMSKNIFLGLKDKYKGIRYQALGIIAELKDSMDYKETEPELKKIAESDAYRPNRAIAISLLSFLDKEEYLPLFRKSLLDSSFSVSIASMLALQDKDMEYVKSKLPLIKKDAKGDYLHIIKNFEIASADESKFDSLYAEFDKLEFGIEKFEFAEPFARFLSHVTDFNKFKKGVNGINSFRKNIQPGTQARDMVMDLLKGILKKKEEQYNKDNSEETRKKVDYLKTIIK